MERLKARGVSEQEIIARMTSGDSRTECPREAMVINTSEVLPDKILKMIRRG